MDYFPLALATGRAFCNRTDEQKHLKYNLQEAKPTLIASPRRYGKSSLALHTILKSKYYYAKFDFLSAVSDYDIEKIILKGVGDLLSRMENGPRKALKLATDLFAGLSIKLSFDKLGLAIEINKKSADPAANILSILERVEKLGKKYNKQLVLFFDEFQRIYEVSGNQAIESVMRQVAQATKQLSFIFSGSNRHLLEQMFNDRNRPFYKLCDRIKLERISESDYASFLNTAAKERWNKKLDHKMITQILHYTERHPYYTNALCSRLWRVEKITSEKINQAWINYIAEERSQVGIELDLLSTSQRKLLVILSRYNGTNAPRSLEFQQLASMPGATITQALHFLERKDYIYQDNEHFYRVLDPLLKSVLAEF